MSAVLENYKEVAEIINEYVKKHGTNECKSNSEIRALLTQNGVELNTMFQPSDLCYNRTTKHDVSGFAEAIHLFEYVGRNSYRILGEKYPYSGVIERRPKGEKNTISVGKWKDGNCIIF